MSTDVARSDEAVSNADDRAAWLHDLGLSVYTAIDVETTGLDARSERVIEVGAVKFREGVAVEEFQSFLSVDRKLDPFIIELTGITDENLSGAPRFEDIAEALSSFLGDSVLVGQNVDFDLQFLSAEGRRAGGNERLFEFRGTRAMDTAMLGRIFWPELSRFSLSHLTREFSVSLQQAHRATADARATGEVLATMIERLPARVWEDLADALVGLISTTTHRSRFFFEALRNQCRGIQIPSGSQHHDDRDSIDVSDSDSIDTWLGADGRLERGLGQFRSRSVQVTMAEQISEAFDENTIALVEAPTGTGKSLAYLIPSLLWATANPEEERQIFISSHTRALQEQLFGKDVQDIGDAAEARIPAAVLKGRVNYLCKRRLRQLLKDAHERLSDMERIRLMSVLRWAALTTTGESSEIGSFNERTDPYLWSQICSDAQTCSGAGCGSKKGDFHRLAVERAASAKLVFVNHALLMSDPNRFLSGPSPKRKLVIDEAHWFERAVVSAMTVEITSGALRNRLLRITDERGGRGLLTRFLRVSDDLDENIQTDAQQLIDGATTLFATIRQMFSALAESVWNISDATSRTLRIRFRKGDRIHGMIRGGLEGLIIQWREFAQEFGGLVRAISDLTGDQRIPPELLLEFKSTSEQLTTIDESLELVMTATEENRVFWIEAGQGRVGPWCAVYTAPVSIGEIMEKEFWPKVDSAVLTSATMTTGASFHHLRGSLGLDSVDNERLRELQLDGPFDLASQMRVMVPTFLPDPKSGDAHLTAVAEMLEALVDSTRRGTLVLCTSLDAVDRISKHLEPTARRTGRQLLTQRSAGSPTSQIRKFREQRDAILIGAASFWEGIDVVGDALQMLVIVRLPFDVPTDPWVAARCDHLRETGQDPFNDFSLPSAILRLKQGIGRLIRHPEDRGVVIIADPRLIRSRFGRRIQDSLPTRIHTAENRDDLLKSVGSFFHTIEI